MTNYEKYKEEIIQILVRGKGCINLLKLSGCEDECKGRICSKCEYEIKHWLNEEAKEFDPTELKEGDKIIMRKYENTKSFEYDVICNCFPTCWLRFRNYENDKPKSDKGFLISYDKLMSEYDVIEVIRE